MNETDKTQAAWGYFSEKDNFEISKDKKIILVANDLNTPENIGGIIRVAGNIGCEKVIFTGKEEDFRMSKIRRAATNGFTKVNWEFCEEQEWPSRIPDDYAKIAIETVAEATDIYKTDLPDKVAFVVGNESFGISDWSLEQCDSALFIPMPGIVKSLNVNQAAAVVMFEWWRRAYLSH